MISDEDLELWASYDRHWTAPTRDRAQVARELLAARRMIDAKDAVLEMLGSPDGWDNPEIEALLEKHEEAKVAWQESRGEELASPPDSTWSVWMARPGYTGNWACAEHTGEVKKLTREEADQLALDIAKKYRTNVGWTFTVYPSPKHKNDGRPRE